MRINKEFQEMVSGVMFVGIIIAIIFIIYTVCCFLICETVVCKNGYEYYNNFYKLSIKLSKDGKPIKCEEENDASENR